MSRSTYARAAIVSACSLAFGASSPLAAASIETDALVSNIRLEAQFLIRAGDLAATNDASEKIKRFAEAQKAEQLNVLDALAKEIPEDAVADMAQGMATGRSIATGIVDIGTFAPPGGIGVTMPAASIGLEHLSTTRGTAFDALYASLTRSVLTNLAGFYEAYAKMGDDFALRAIAVHELPHVKADIAALD